LKVTTTPVPSAGTRMSCFWGLYPGAMAVMLYVPGANGLQ
jgi:hypothetical protein